MSGSFFVFRTFVVLCSLLPVFVLGACDAVSGLTKIDRTASLSRQDYRDAFAPRDVEDSEDSQGDASSYGDIPSLKPYVSHNYVERKSFPLVTVSVNRSVPLRDVFYQLAEQSDYDVELDPGIIGSIIFTARNRPLDQVVERICDVARLRYSLEGGVMRVERDTPYNKIYKLDYLSFLRSNSSSIQTSVTVSGEEGADTGSSFSSNFESSSDFWVDLEENLTTLLSLGQKASLTTQEDPEVESIDQLGDSVGDAVISIGSISGGTAAGTETEIDQQAQFVINKQAGIISVYATQHMQEQVKEFLEGLKKSLTAQVLIEAKVVEVELYDEYAAGVDWSIVDSGIGGFDVDYLTSSGLGGSLTSPATDYSPFPGGSTSGSITPSSSFVASFTGRDLSALIRAISEFGTTKALASPRLVVLNNQTAVLNVARNRVFFLVTDTATEEDADTGDERTTVDYDTRTVPEGVIINVMPSINLEDRTISLAIRPSITDIGNDLILNPFVSAETYIPQVSIQEVDTVLNVESGQTTILGGLMRDSQSATQDGVPVLSDMPLVGSLFRSHYDVVSKTELIIFLKATILEKASDAIHDTDRDIYRKFSSDRRPFKM